MTGTLTSGNGALIGSQPVRLEIFNSTTGQWQTIGTKVTNQQGAISFQVDLNYPAGDYRARFFYAGGGAGSASYYPTSAEFTVSIKPAKITMTISTPSISTTDNVPVEISVKNADGKPLAGVSIAIYVDNVQRTTAQTDANGEARVVLKLELNEAGSHTIAAKVKSTNYTSTQTSASLLTILPVWLIALLILATLAGIAAVGLVILGHQNRKHSLPASPSA